jgi:4-carboxymuconolactone decarboxylase
MAAWRRIFCSGRRARWKLSAVVTATSLLNATPFWYYHNGVSLITRRMHRTDAALIPRSIPMPARTTGQDGYQQALDAAERLLGQPLSLPLAEGEPPVGEDFRRLATLHTFGDSWPRRGLDDRSRALISVTIAATLGTHEPLRGQLRIALHSGVTKEEIVELFIHLAAYAGAARAFDSYQTALAVFAETS